MQRMDKDFFYVFINLIVQCIFLLIYLPIALFNKYYGLLIGGGFGLIASSLSVFLILKGSSGLLKIGVSPSDDKSVNKFSNTFSFILMFLGRAIVSIGLLFLTIFLQFKLQIEAFNFSFITYLISLTSIIGVVPLSNFLYKKIFKVENVTELKSSDQKIQNDGIEIVQEGDLK